MKRQWQFGVWMAAATVLTVTPLYAESLNVPASLQPVYAGSPPDSIQQLRLMERHQRQLARLVAECTVGVRVGASQGSGVLISEDGLVLTAAHVASRADAPCVIVLPDGRQVPGRTLGLNRTRDAGLVKILGDGKQDNERPEEDDAATGDRATSPRQEKWPHLEMAPDGTVKQGMWCLATGHPGGFERGRRPVVRVGRVLFVSPSLIRTDCVLVGGDSGGPLCDMQGRVIGIHSRIGGPITMNLHIPVKPFRDSWDRLVAAEAWGAPPGSRPVITGAVIGVSADPLASDARIGSVDEGLPADRAGIRRGDVILRFDGEAVPDFSTLAKLVRSHLPGDVVLVELRRGDEMIQLKLKIGQRAP